MSSVIKAPAGADLEFVAGAGKSVKFTTDAGSVDIANLATEGFVTAEINNVIAAAPGALDTLNELAAALGDDASFSTTITNALSTKAAAADVYTKTAADTLLAGKANTATTLAGYGITDAYTDTEVDTALSAKADATSVYTKTEIDTDWYTATEVDTAITNNNVNFVNVGLATKQAAFVAAPTSSIGQDGDLAGMIATDTAYIYRCVANFDGTTNIWARVALTLETW
jgi:hypothetical protein